MKKSVLFVTVNSDIARGNGKFSSSVYSALKQMLGKNVYSVCVDSCGMYNGELYDECIKSSKRSKLIKGLLSIKQLLNKEPASIDKKGVSRILEIIAEKNIDHVYLDESTIGHLIPQIRKMVPSVKITTCFHDIKKILVKDWMKNQSCLYYPHLRNCINNELSAVRLSNNILTLNTRDTQLLHDCYNQESTLELPIIIADEFAGESTCKHNDDYVLFVGTSYYPNVEGIFWFVNNVFENLDNLKLFVVGNGMDKYKNELESLNSNITVYGRVESLTSFYQNATMVIAPIFKGGGMKVKVAEALMHGKIVVGTTEAFEGYEVEDLVGELANTKEKFADAIKSLQGRESFQQKNRAYYLKYFSQESAVKKLSGLFR